MLLAGNGLTTPVLEAALGTALRVRVLRQDDVAVEQIPAGIAGQLRLVGQERVVVRRSCLVDPVLNLVSVNLVIAAAGPATASGIDRLDKPIGYSLIAPGISQQRHNLRVGLARWPDGRECAVKAYLVLLDDQPLCYIRECFNPSLISADLFEGSHRDSLARAWDDEPMTVPPVECGVHPASGLPVCPALHQPVWPDVDAAHECGDRLRALPPLVSMAECERLTYDLAAACAGRSFVLHLGDCAETFDSCTTPALVGRQALAAAAASVLAYGSGLRVVTIGRIAGQYAKPRSQPIEASTGLLSYFGDMVNSAKPDRAARVPDPHRMLAAYFHSAVTLNHLRAHPVPPSAAVARLIRRAVSMCPTRAIADMLGDVANMVDLAFVAPPGSHVLHSLVPELRISHEALVLGYEHALTRCGAHDRLWDSSAHLLWIGERTRQLDHAHIELARRIANPVAVKLGPTTSPGDVIDLCQRLNPRKLAGRLMLIPRLGVGHTERLLPKLMDAAAASTTPVCWVCDPMHGNTRLSGDRRKTRHLEDIIAEIRAFFCACRDTGTAPAGLHLETSPDEVTECLGGWQQLDESHLASNYRTRCDPRLNDIQTISCVTVAVQELAVGKGWAAASAKQLAPQCSTQPRHTGEDELAHLDC
ncbi:3-deoxy-7-phosphoheptulonate synthase [Mycobacterium heidelbergense]|uniref:3-deoxy-7-phosphoheptulonate synthase n=1 Tax=Mycobacterium heidelbergense TaxID=53376 RepID=UPI003CEB3403